MPVGPGGGAAWASGIGTYYDRPERPEKSPTVFNLCYTPEVAREYPYVAELSGGPSTSSGQAWRLSIRGSGSGADPFPS